MNVTLLKALIAFLPACLLFLAAIVLSFKEKSAGSLLQLIGAGCLVIVVLTHVLEALRVFSRMGWGS